MTSTDIGPMKSDRPEMPDRAAVRAALLRAVERAVRAPSVHNTQPWRFVLRGATLEIHADPSRQLRVLDPRGRQMTISCGCALFNARVALAALGYEAIVDRFPDDNDLRFLTRVTVRRAAGDWLPLSTLDSAIDGRRTNRRAFADERVSADVVFDLVAAARGERVVLLPITEPDHLRAVAHLSREADRIENSNPAYLAELRTWTSDDALRPDGVLMTGVAFTGPGAEQDDELPLRAFDTTGFGWLPASSHSGTDQCLLLLGTMDDGPAAWLRAGEALERVWLELTDRSYSASPLTQVVEVRETHNRLRERLRLEMHPDLLLRVGRAPDTVQTRRRPISDVLTEAD